MKKHKILYWKFKCQKKKKKIDTLIAGGLHCKWAKTKTCSQIQMAISSYAD